MSSNEVIKEAVIIGGGISGLATARWFKQYKIDFIVLERTDDIGGLWRYREDDYGVMKFTHINVSKYNYCYSDHQFPESASEYPDHIEMHKYVCSYADKHSLMKSIRFNTMVLSIEEYLQKVKLSFNTVKSHGKLWRLVVKDLTTNEETIYITPYVCIASGHHSAPKYPKFKGQESFNGEILHSVKFKSATFNNLNGKRVLIVGIGNSAVDAAVNLVNEGRCPKVCVSTRSGAWIIPNYVNGYPTDLYACRTFLHLPWKAANSILEAVIKFIYGDPRKFGLNPKMKALQAQPTLNPTIHHHIQRRNVLIKPNIKSIDGNMVTFENGESDEFDAILLCTGYNIDVNYLGEGIRKKIFSDNEQTILNLYKNVYSPDIGPSLAFIGFIQPSSGGVLEVSEIQSRWALYTMLGQVQLPEREQMLREIKADQKKISDRYYHSERLTIQKDPILYCDEISEYFGAKPSLIKNPALAWRLLFSSCGPAQWRLNGPDQDENAKSIVQSVPITPMMNVFGFVLLALIVLLILAIFNTPLLFLTTFGLSYFMWKQMENN